MDIVNDSIEDPNQIQDLRSANCDDWPNDDEGPNNNSTLLYIAVEYVEKQKSTNISEASSQATQDTFTDFVTPQVSPLDPNMSCTAQYSPVPVQYEENPDNQISPIVIQQFITEESDTGQDFSTSNTLDSISSEIPAVLCNNELRETENQYFEMVQDDTINICNDGGLELEPEAEQGVELLITDHTTGISYSVNTQQLMVEHCLEDNQNFLETIAPEPLLESDLLELDENTELNNSSEIPNIVTSLNEETMNTLIQCLSNKTIEINEPNPCKINTRSSNQNKVNPEEELLSCVYSIMDKPVLSRARASLPESYLCINTVNEENGVFAKKLIPKKTQFGPLEGSLFPVSECVNNKDKNLWFHISINGNEYVVDVTDESLSNWMIFVRKAETFDEHNLILTQEGNGLYFTTIRHIKPKEELKFHYSHSYAQQFNLELLKPVIKDTWPCFECSEKFPTSEELQKHLDVHDEEGDENTRPKRKYRRRMMVLRKSQSDIVECNMCQEPFGSTVSFSTLKNHLSRKHKFTGVKIGDYFSIFPNYACNYCDMRFRREILLNIHRLEHDPELSVDQMNHVCPQCLRKFPTRKQLVLHVTTHALPKKVTNEESVKCNVCYKSFARKESLQKHMLVHGSEETKPLKCDKCEKRFLTRSALTSHAKNHFTDRKNFQCPICNESFYQVMKLKLHIPKHAQDNQYTCPYCKKTFRKYSIIRKHIRTFHREPKFHCEHCAKMYSSLEHLKKHMLKHSDHREFLCADCGKQFKRKDKLVEHIRNKHPVGKKNVGGEVPIPKKKRSTVKNELGDYERYIYKCHSCRVGFKRRGMLVNHLAKKHPEVNPESVPELSLPILQTTKDYYCQYCEKIYKSSSKRKIHILKCHPGAELPVNVRKPKDENEETKTEETSATQATSFSLTVGSVPRTPKNCRWCHKQYASRAKLLQHAKKEHPDKSVKELMRSLKVAKPKDTTAQITDDKVTLLEKSKEILAQSKDYVNVENVDVKNFASTELTVTDDICLTRTANLTTDGTITVPLDCLHTSDMETFGHLSIEDGILDRSDLSHSSHLYHLLEATNNGLLPPP